jgi:hypothetical protein
MPGYWAYGEDGYYWVPGAWVPAPYEGALWTPGYWGWTNGFYVWHGGYWGPHVGYYGGVNYGFGYMGIGFVGGIWQGGFFRYNTAIMHVDGRYIHNTYEDRNFDRFIVARDSHVAFSGGPGGIRHDALPEERLAEHDNHVAANSFQRQHEMAARSDHASYFRANGGHPATLAVQRPMGAHTMAQPSMRSGSAAPQARPQEARPQQQARPMTQPQAQPHAAPEARRAPEARQVPQSRPAPEARPAPQSRSAESRPQASRPAPSRSEEKPKGEKEERH